MIVVRKGLGRPSPAWFNECVQEPIFRLHVFYEKTLSIVEKVNTLLSLTAANYFPLSDPANIISDSEHLAIYFVLLKCPKPGV